MDAPAPGTCAVYPAIPGTPARPATTRYEPYIGWDSGANSVKVLDGPVRLAFTQPQVQGVAIGLTQTRANPEQYARITHGFMFGSDAVGRPVFRVLESGRTLTSPAIYDVTDVFAIERVGQEISYWRNDQRLLRSAVPSVGEVMAGCSLYASGDAVESEESP